MPNRTNPIGTGTRNLVANAPQDWQVFIGQAAMSMNISAGELMRSLLLVGAKAKLPELAVKLEDSHRKYYPHRAALAAVLLGLFLGGLVMAGTHQSDLRRARASRVRVEEEVAA